MATLAVINRPSTTSPVIFGILYIFTLIGLLKQVSDITYVLVDPRIDFESRKH